MRVKFAFLLCLLSLLLPLYSMAAGTSDRIAKDEAVADVHQFFGTLQRVHPDLLAKVDVDDYIKLKQQTLDDIDKKLDQDGRISVNDLAYMLYYAAAFFGDGHTLVQWRFQPDESNTEGKRFPPFLLGYDNGRFVVITSSNKNIERLEILMVNGKPVREFLSPILDRCSAETFTCKAVCFIKMQSFWYCFSDLFDSAKSLTLKLQDVQGKQSEQKVDTVGFADFQKLISDISAAKPDQPREKGTRVSFLDSDRIAYLVYPSCIFSEDEKKKIDGIFEEIKSKKSQDLIIDIRGNGGGNSAMGDFIFSYLYGKKFSSFSKGRTKLSRDVQSSYCKDNETLGRADLEGLTVTFISGEEKNMTKPNAFFSGRSFLLVGNSTFSAAVTFTTLFRDYGVGNILGYETGGVPICFADVYSFKLKNSGIPCGVSYKQVLPPKPRPGDDEHGVLPEIPMDAKLLRPYRNEADPVLAFTLDHIKKTRKSH